MSVEVHVPELGESIVDATIASWLKKEGDAVKRGDTLAELETDKVNVEVNADQDGVLQKVLKQVGDVVGVGEAICIIGEGTASASATNGSAPQAVATEASPSNPRETSPTNTGNGATAAFSDTQRPPSPLARRIAAEHHVDISQVRGSSPHGRVTKEDVITYLEQSTQPTAPAETGVDPVSAAAQPAPQKAAPAAVQAGSQPSADESNGRVERIRMSRRRQTIAQRLVEAQHTAAMLTTFNEIDMSAIMDVRNRRKDAFKEKHNVSLGFMSFFTKAAVGALKAYPRLNAEIQGTDILLKHYYDISIAVSTDEGLVVPVVRDADRKGFAQIEREIAELAKKARANTLSLADLQGGTFTITNGGIFGSLLSTPILNAPQVGILGMHKIEQRPIALNGQVVIRPMMYVALSYDHRIVDGSEAVRFLATIKELAEDPESLLLEG
ncbi:dihydrolipoyllysine-residue succinyltransferase component of 2-oxoglutarate dehydrogenase complex [Dictyobacter alpinus]|uniref:Dihydrolipoyllysine-residue succinyltransferase component of 2-oxoglutarate dehydrogenase complex n=1 Tax=Dictyobacter alpinus TaxID=2014873 RepID=A0A402AZV1_9CHLR|nr:2-oxoglutarate dehydrogenase complex dihydrolipoyllysine-residue succinyltransferase [Dictyobacter alpinus]GCE24630.1 dihydrolipoyllysine-residue succinyltransferase component of 2-oxoglutarate dehydrogenase complex [Dictyobacter alpinus]